MSNPNLREGVADVPGAQLRYALAGTPGHLPTIVLENGWGASYHYFTLLRDQLTPHAQVLLYNRAGIGGSVALAPQDPPTMSRHLAALLDGLGIAGPVIVAGQSYGGLICGVHAGLIPQRLRAVVQIDPTPERADPQIDSTLGQMRGVGKFLKLLAKLRIPEPVFSNNMQELPPQDTANLRRWAFGNTESMNNALIEMNMIHRIRESCAIPSPVPRLVISAGRTEEIRNGLLRLLVSPERATTLLKAMQGQHRATAQRGGKGSEWIALPHTHGGLVTTRAGAQATAACMLEYLRKLP